MTQDQKGHKWFAAVWEWMVNHESELLRRTREHVAGGAAGRVLEVGCGPGSNFPYYGESVSELIAIDPDPYMLERARRRAEQVGRLIEIKQAPAEELPFDDASFDTIVCTSVMCTVSDPHKALSEVRRVLIPEGEYRFFEHVRYDHAAGALFQNAINPIWSWFGAGCQLNRDTARLIQEAGFVIQELEALKPTPLPNPSRPCIAGIARPV